MTKPTKAQQKKAAELAAEIEVSIRLGSSHLSKIDLIAQALADQVPTRYIDAYSAGYSAGEIGEHNERAERDREVAQAEREHFVALLSSKANQCRDTAISLSRAPEPNKDLASRFYNAAEALDNAAKELNVAPLFIDEIEL